MMNKLTQLLFVTCTLAITVSNTFAAVVNYKGVEVNEYKSKLVFGINEQFKGSPQDLINIKWLTYAMYSEARSDGVQGMLMVLNVVHNRIEDKRFPDTVKSVILQHKQFSAFNKSIIPDVTLDNSKEKKLLLEAVKRAYNYVMYGKFVRMTYGTHYHTVHVKPKWASHTTYLGKIGQHIVYK